MAATRMIEEREYDSRFDMAVREWARSDERAAAAVKASDEDRLATLRQFFVSASAASSVRAGTGRGSSAA